MQLSSHKNEATIKAHSTKCPPNKCHEMCETLSDAILQEKAKMTHSCTVSVNPDKDIKEVVLNLPNFDMIPIDDFDTIDDKLLAELVYEAEQKNQEKDENQDKHDKQSKEIVQVTKTQAVSTITTPTPPMPLS